MSWMFAAVAREFAAYARLQPGEAVALIGVRPDASCTMIALSNRAEHWRSRFVLDWDEVRAAIRSLGESGHKFLIRAHAGPGHVSPSHDDVDRLGDQELIAAFQDYLRACDMLPPVVDMVLSQTTGRWGFYLIEKPPAWSGRPRDGYRPVDPFRLWEME